MIEDEFWFSMKEPARRAGFFMGRGKMGEFPDFFANFRAVK